MNRWKENWFCFCGRKERSYYDPVPLEPEPFSLPSPIPQWPKGGGFAKGRICMGELELIKISKFQRIWSYLSLTEKNKGASFYKPIGIPHDFSLLGHYCHPNDTALHGFTLAIREISQTETHDLLPALKKPIDYTLVWNSDYCSKDENDPGIAYFWIPSPPEGYKAMGFLVTLSPGKPSLDEIRCVRSDLTDQSEIYKLFLNIKSDKLSNLKFQVWSTRPSHRGMWGRGVQTGTFFCLTDKESVDNSNPTPVCLKNVEFDLNSMPNLEQIHALIQHYGPTMFFHPKEKYLPCSVSWFFKSGATLHKNGESNGEAIDTDGSSLPTGGENDGQYWIDLPTEDSKSYVKFGNLESSELYCHVKPSLSGTFTDIAMWVFCPFNGPATVKIGKISFPLGKIGRHVSDWEHFTLRICNFSGELWSIYFSQHSGGVWVDIPELEFITGNKAVVYSSKSGHASYAHAGDYLQGSEKLGIGIRNAAARSDFVLDSSAKYQIVAAEYLGDDVAEPNWLQFMREWGPTVRYRSRREADKMIRYLPLKLRCSLERMMNRLPCELYREEGPTGPKEKNNWVGDERC